MHRGVTLSGMRLFIGIALAAEASDALNSVRERFEPGSGDLRWSQPESWHVTLQFLGAATEEQFGVRSGEAGRAAGCAGSGANGGTGIF